MPVPVRVVQTGLEKSIADGAKAAGRNLKINMGPGARSIESLSKPLGRLTGKADEFTKSMEAANARVLAFGASVGVISAVTKGMQELVRTTIEVEKSLLNINSILKQTDTQLNNFKNTIFDIARNTGQSFETVAEAALELSRQGLAATEVTKRLNDALVLSRLSGLSAADSVAGLTAAINSFSNAGITSAEVLNKISAAAASAAVSDRDLIEGLKRSGSVAVAAGVQFDELVGIIGALQERTSRGGAVIGNSLKTIFTRIQDIEKLRSLQGLGVEVTDLSGKVLSSNKIIENLAPTFAKLDQASKVNLADNLVGKFQIAPFLALLEDYNLKISRSGEIANTSLNASNEAYERNKTLNEALAAAINTATVNLQQLGEALGRIGVTENLSNILDFFNSFVKSINDVLNGEGVGSDLAKGIVKGIGAVLSGPGLALFGAIVAKLILDFSKFGVGALKTFFGLNKAAERQASLQGQIAATLLNDKKIREDILTIENQNISKGEKRKQQADYFENALREQLSIMQQMQGIAATITPSVMAATEPLRGKKGKRAAGGFLPIGAERSDIARGVGGAPSSAKPVVIPNFAFGGGQRGTMVANTSEYIVPNYANGGDAIFNQNMASSMGLPANARKVRAASGYIPNFANKKSNTTEEEINQNENIILLIGTREKGDDPNRIIYGSKASDGEMRYSANKDAEYLKNIKSNIGYQIHVPTYTIAPNEKGKPPFDTATMSDELSKLVGEKAVESLLQIPDGDKVLAEKGDFLRGYVKPSSMNATSGLMFEGIIQSFLQGPKFDKAEGLKSNTRLDLPVDKHIRSLFKIDNPKAGEIGAEAKYSGETKHVKSAADKIFDVMVGHQAAFGSSDLDKFAIGKTGANALGVSPRTLFGNLDPTQKQTITGLGARSGSGKLLAYNSASGYIPNFAQGALEEAIGRERAAGLPINQIRINQNPKLRSSQNPMGLAITNTRDEPTGAIPNFADPWNKGVTKAEVTGAGFAYTKKGVEEFRDSLKDASKEVDKNAQGQRNSFGKLLLLQSAMTGLAGATGDAEGKFGQFTNSISDAIATGAAVATAAEGISAFGESLADAGGTKGAIGKFMGKLGGYGQAIAVGVGVFKAATSVYDDLTGVTDAVNDSMMQLEASAKNAAQTLDNLDPDRKKTIQEESEGALDWLKRNGLNPSGWDLIGSNKIEEQLIDIFNRGQARGLSVKEMREKASEINRGKSSFGKLQMDQLTSYVTGRTEQVKNQTELEFFKDPKKFLAQTVMPKEGGGIQSVSDSRLGEILLGMTPGDISTVVGKGKFTKGSKVSEQDQKYIQDMMKFLEAPFSANNISKDVKDKELIRILTAFQEINKQNVDASKERIALNQQELQQLQGQAQFEKLIQDQTRKNNASNRKYSQQQVNLQSEIFRKEEDRVAKLDEINRKKDRDVSLQKAALQAARDFNANLQESATKDIFSQGSSEKFLQKFSEYIVGLQLHTEEGYDSLKKLDDLFNNPQDDEGIAKRNLLLKQFGIDADEAGKAAEAAQVPIKKLLNEFSVQRFGILSELAEKFFEASQKLKGAQGSRETTDTDRLAQFTSRESFQSQRALALAKVNQKTSEQFTIDQRLAELSQPILNEGFIPGNRRAVERTQLQRRNEEIQLEKQLAALQLKADQTAQDYVMGKTKAGDSSKVFAEKDVKGKKAAELRNELDKEHQTILDDKLSILQIETQELEAQLELVKNRKTEEELIKAGIDKYGAFGFGFRDSFSKNFTDTESSAKTLGEELGNASAQFAYNIGNAMLDAVQKGGDLGDILLGTASEFLNMISRAFMKNAVNDFVGSFMSNQNQSGGPIRGGSGVQDDVPAMLMGGEFVINKRAVKKYGLGFMSALNNGAIQGFAKGGQVRDIDDMYRTPGMGGAGAIVGGANLLAFATQSPFALNRDSISDSGAFLDAESGRMTMFGRRNNPEFQRVQDAKRQAFDLYASEEEAKMEAIRQEKANKKQLMDSFKGAILSAGLSYGLSAMGSGFSNAFGASKAAGGTFGANFKAGLGGIWSGGGEGNMGGLKNIFTGNFKNATNTLSFDKAPSTTKTATFTGPFDKNGNYVEEWADLSEAEIRRRRGFATGGLIPATGGVDTVPAMLSGGEFVMNAAATRNIGAGNLQALNSGAGTGDSSELVAKLDELILATENSQATGDINITINGSTGAENKTSDQDASEQQKMLSEKIKVAVKQVIADEQRLGGQLRK